MRSEDFRRQVLAALPEVAAPAPDGGDDLSPFTFVSEVFTPGFLDALERRSSGDESVDERLTVLSRLLEEGIADGDGYLLDALVMRVLERHLARRPDLYAAARPFLGPATTEGCDRLAELIESSRQQLAEAAARRAQQAVVR